jgi:hypothetical protein
MLGTLIALVLWILVAADPVRAQQSDPQTEEIQERDRRYYQRQEETARAPAEPAEEETARRRAEFEAFLEEADRSVRDRNYSGREGEHYKVQTDDPRLSPQAAVDLLESFRAFFESFWSGRFALRPYEEPARAYLFYSYFKYNQLLTGKKKFGDFRTVGHYRPFFDVIVLHTDAVPGELADALVHEAAHQQAARRLFPEGREVSPWLSEGLASYFGYTLEGPDGYEPGSIGGKARRLFPRAKKAQSGSGWRRVQQLRKEWKKLEPWPVAEIVAIEHQGEFLSESAEERYVASWLLVHYLLHGEEGGHREAFFRYVDLERNGAGGAEALYRELSLDGESLERGLRTHVREIKPEMRKK